jgi:hypothetical protein
MHGVPGSLVGDGVVPWQEKPMATAVTTAGSRAVHHFPGRNSDKVIAYRRVRRKPGVHYRLSPVFPHSWKGMTTMWAPISFGLLVAFAGNLAKGNPGLAIAFGVLAVALLATMYVRSHRQPVP